MIGTMGFALVACGKEEKTTETTEVVVEETESANVETSEEEIYEGFNMSNPWVDSDQAGVLSATGFDMVPPAEATNIYYSYMPSTGMAQLNYNMSNAMWVYRMMSSDVFEDISGVYCEWDFTEETQVAGMEAVEYGYASETEGESIDGMNCTRVLNWYDAQNKIVYSLCINGTDLDGLDTVVYAESLLK